MQDVVDISPSERHILLSGERETRFRLARIVGTAFGGLFIIAFFLVLAILEINPGWDSPSLILLDRLFPVAALICGVGIWLAQQGRALWAALCVVGATLAITSLFDIVWAINRGIDPLVIISIGTLPIVIALAALLGDNRLMIASTIFANIITLLVIYGVPVFHGGNNVLQHESLVGLTPLMQQWGMATVLLASGYLRTLRQLGTERIANERAKKLDEIKDQFISNVNHELRTPVMAVMGLLDLALLEQEMAPEYRHDLLVRARDASIDLVELLQSILEVRRVDQESQDFVFEVVSVRETLEAASRLIDPREAKMIERDLIETIPDGLSIWGERVRLRQIFTNLLSNAIKYSAPGTPIAVTARVYDNDPSSMSARLESKRRNIAGDRQMVEIAIRDYGLGIPPDQAPLLFQRFVRLPRDLSSTINGNGLGLYLCRVFAEAMGGSIWVESTGIVGQGSTFYLLLPLPPQEEAQTPPDAEEI